MSKDKILASLPNLTKKELTEISQLILQLLSQKDPEIDASAERWLTAFNAVLGSNRMYATVSKTRAGGDMRRNAKGAEEFLNALAPTKLKNTVGKAAIRKYLAELLAADLKRREIPTAMGTLAINLARLSEVVDSAFPGYRNAGLTHLIFQRLTGGKYD